MKLLLFVNLACLLGLSLAKFAPLSDEQIEYINSIQTSWKAGRNFDPSQYGYAKTLLGTDLEQNALYNQQHPAPVKTSAMVVDLPESFDSREQWPDCWTMKEVRDQGECGSCWAVASASTMSDRIYVATGENVRISSQDLVSCCGRECGDGCDGGWPLAAWNWFVSDGVVTGGHYNSHRGCAPYLLPPCDHHCSGELRNCSQYSRPTPKCHPACIEEYNATYSEDKRHGLEVFHVQGVEAIMSEIYTNGPVTASFNVYDDFMSYTSGVYKYVTGENLGGHSVKIIGWGVEDGQDYWLVVNSWNTDWAEEGLFKIAKGTNECTIEGFVVAGSIAV